MSFDVHMGLDLATVLALTVLYGVLILRSPPALTESLLEVDRLFAALMSKIGVGALQIYMMLMGIISAVAALLAPHPAYNIALFLPIAAFALLTALKKGAEPEVSNGTSRVFRRSSSPSALGLSPPVRRLKRVRLKFDGLPTLGWSPAWLIV